MSVLQRLTEGVRSRDMQAEGAALLNKWEATGLLEGLNDSQTKQGMAVLLENQAKELLREASSMAAGDVEGFAAVAFPIVRRVFGGLIANDLVSVQPMSLPSGLIFFLDFTHSDGRMGAVKDKSVYGTDEVGSEIISGVTLAGTSAEGPKGHYELGHGDASAFDTDTVTKGNDAKARFVADTIDLDAGLTEAQRKLLRYDADILALASGLEDGANTHQALVFEVLISDLENSDQLDTGHLSAIAMAIETADGDFDVDSNGNARVVRRLTSIVNAGWLRFTVVGPNASLGAIDITAEDQLTAGKDVTLTYPLKDGMDKAGVPIGAVGPDAPWHLEEPNPAAPGVTGGAKASGAEGDVVDIAEIDIKVDSIAVTAQTKKLKAKWSPELGQDLNAYHNLDAEVELTGILSEQIALEIDRELLGELVNGATAGTRYWSRSPGLFVDDSGAEVGWQSAAPDFTGTVSEWYETLIETINDVSAQIHRKTLRGGANFVVCSPEVANILEFTSGFRASVTADQDRGTIGAVKAGSLSKKFDVYVDPYFIRNVILVGRKGSSFLESGFVYAPYVPLQVTPTIFGTEDFVPRKGVMTRYAKQMVRPDMYGLVVVRGLLGESGRSA